MCLFVCVGECVCLYVCACVCVCVYVCVAEREKETRQQECVLCSFCLQISSASSISVVCVCGCVGVGVRESVCVPQTAVALFLEFAHQAQPPLLLVHVYILYRHAYIYIRAFLHTHIRACMHTCLHAYILSRRSFCSSMGSSISWGSVTHTHTHTHMYIHIHIHTHMYIHTNSMRQHGYTCFALG